MTILRERLIKVDEQRNTSWKKASDLIAFAASEERSLTGDEQAQYDGWVGEVDTLGEERTKILAHEERAKALEAPQRDARMLPGNESRGAGVGGERGRQGGRSGRVADTDEYRDAFVEYMLRGERRMAPDQLAMLDRGYQRHEERALSVTTSAGGYLIPQGFEPSLTKARLQFGGVRQARTRKITTETGAPYPIPGLNDTGNKGVLLAINTQMAKQDVAFTQRTLNAYVMHSKAVDVPWQLDQDSYFDIENDVLMPAFGERIGRIENDYFTSGAGTTEPLGIVTAATAANTGTGSAAAGPTFAEYVALFHAVDPSYRAMAQWMASDSLIAATRQVVDDNNRPIWLPAATGGLSDDVPERILGKEVIINQSMDAPSVTGGFPLIFGDMSYYWIRDVRGVTMVRLDQIRADYLQTEYFAYARTDGILVDAGTHPIKKFTSAAS